MLGTISEHTKRIALIIPYGILLCLTLSDHNSRHMSDRFSESHIYPIGCLEQPRCLSTPVRRAVTLVEDTREEEMLITSIDSREAVTIVETTL